MYGGGLVIDFFFAIIVNFIEETLSIANNYSINLKFLGLTSISFCEVFNFSFYICLKIHSLVEI